MKKILGLLFCFSALLSCDTVTAQVTKPMKTSITSAIDSITCVGTTANYLYIVPSQRYNSASFQSNIRRKSAAMGGTLTLQGSNDNVTYFTTAASDTIHVTDGATDSGALKVPTSTGLPFRYFRMKCVGLASDTMYVHILFNGQ